MTEKFLIELVVRAGGEASGQTRPEHTRETGLDELATLRFECNKLTTVFGVCVCVCIIKTERLLLHSNRSDAPLEMKARFLPESGMLCSLISIINSLLQDFGRIQRFLVGRSQRCSGSDSLSHCNDHR